MSECIPCHTKYRDPYGRAKRRVHGQGNKINSSRATWIETNGPIEEGLVVRHTCDNPECVNIDHLLLGTQQQNITDCVVRGRRAKQDGSNNSNWKGGISPEWRATL
jgi:hypothetical protein